MMKMHRLTEFDGALYGMPDRIKKELNALPFELKHTIEEVRIRADSPIYITTKGENIRLPLNATAKETEEAFFGYCDHSVYSHEEEIKQGFIMLKNGHRAGICGRAVYDKGKLKSICDITSLNIRISRQVNGAAEMIVKEFCGRGILIFGPPSSGKTTLLRDTARSLEKRTVIIDTRGEIAAGDVGPMTDVLLGVKKADGIQMAVKVLNPEVIIFDEISTTEEVRAVEEGFNCGVPVITTAHAGSIKELEQRPATSLLLKSGAIDTIYFINNRKVIKI